MIYRFFKHTNRDHISLNRINLTRHVTTLFFKVTSIYAIAVALFFVPFAYAEGDKDVRLSELSWIDNQYFNKQRTIIDDLGREHFGTRIRGNRSDLRVLQRIIDGQHIGRYDTGTHKALGITLGDIYVKEQGWLWREYQDDLGRSFGVCIPDTLHCVFPLSMITRRMRVTTEIDLTKVYERGLGLMQAVMPNTPYTVEEEAPPVKDPLKGKKITPFF